MKYQIHSTVAPTSYHHEQHEQHEQHLGQLAQLEQMQLHQQHNYQNSFNNQQHYLTIEDIKSTRNSCWLCGCNWLEDHVSLDCPECGGYALSRPCPNCDGKCQQTWTRNISATHDRHKALWVGQCKFQSKQTNTLSDTDRFKAAARAAATIITNSKQMMFAPACGSPYQTGKPVSATTTTAQLTTGSTAASNLLAAPSSCCSSQPSSAASSDEEPDDLPSK